MLKQNISHFKDYLEDYKLSYKLREAEEYLVNKNFIKPKAKVLVLGCGAGRVLPPLAKKGFRVWGVDVVDEMVEAAKAATKNLDVKVAKMDAVNMTFEDNSFDYAFFPFHGIDYNYPDIYRAVRETVRILKKDGVFIFDSHNRWFLKRLPKIWQGKYFYDRGLITYQSTPFEYFKLKKYFQKVEIRYRISMRRKEQTNWKDRCYQMFPWLSKSICFICQEPKK